MDRRRIVALKDRLNQPLPGFESHKKVMGLRKPFVANLHNNDQPKQSAVLVHLYLYLSELHVVFIQRPEYDGVHSRQISFPGGKLEPSDKTKLQTAIREANEEVNIEESKIEILGALSELYIPPSNFLVQPFVSFQKERPLFIPDDREVDRILEVPVRKLIDQNLSQYEILKGKNSLQVKGYKIEDEILWGASAMITREFLDIYSSI